MLNRLIVLTGPRGFKPVAFREDQRTEALKAFTSHYDGCAVGPEARAELRVGEHRFVEGQTDQLSYDESTYTMTETAVWRLDFVNVPATPPVL